MKVEELVLAKCINNEKNDFVLGQLYVVDEIHIGQSSSSVRIDGIYCNSIWFKYYDANMNEIDIYRSKYSPYFREEDKEIEEVPYRYSFGFIDCGGLSDIARDELDKNFNCFADKLNKVIRELNELKKEGK